MSAKTYTFIFPDGDFLQQSFRCTQDAIDYAKEELDGLGCVSISREITKHHDIGTVENGVFTASTQEPTAEAALLAACETVINDCDTILNGDDMSGMSDEELFTAIKQTLTAAIAKAKGGAK